MRSSHRWKLHLSRNALASALIIFAATRPACGAPDDWPRWRGPGGLGLAPEGTKLRASWSKEDIAWRRPIDGWGNSSPIVAGGRIYLTTQTEDSSLHVVAIDRASGDPLWTRRVGQGSQKAHKLHNMASPTPVSDGKRVWALFGTGLFVCLDASGKTVWEHDLQKDLGKYSIQWGMGSSPVRHDGRVFVVCMDQGPSYVLAVDENTGDEAWKRERDLKSKGEARDSYSTPLIVNVDGGAQLVVAGADHINAYRPKSGEELWVSSGLQVSHPYGRTIASPTFGSGRFFAVASGFRGQGHVRAVRVGGKGDVTKSHHDWTYDGKYAPDCSTPVCLDDRVYMIRDNGIATCLNAENGNVLWEERLFRGDVKSSPVAGDGKVYFTSVDGECKALAADDTFRVVGESHFEETTMATPAVSEGQFFFRTKRALYAVKK